MGNEANELPLCAITGNGLYKRRDGVEVKLEWDEQGYRLFSDDPVKHWRGNDGHRYFNDGRFWIPPYYLDIVELISLDKPEPELTQEPEPVVLEQQWPPEEVELQEPYQAPNEVFDEQEEAAEPEDIGIQRLQAARHLIELYGGEYSIAAKAVKSAAWMYAKV